MPHYNKDLLLFLFYNSDMFELATPIMPMTCQLLHDTLAQDAKSFSSYE